MSLANPPVPGDGHSPTEDTLPQTPFPGHPARLLPLDVLRGIAVLAAVFVSIWVFGGFSDNQQNGLLLQAKGWNFRFWASASLLLEGKMRALICLVFGAGMVLFLMGRPAGKTPVADLFIRKHMWLMAFGLLNALLFLWTNDLLFHLGLMGILLFPFARLSWRGLLLAAITVTLIYSAKKYWNYSDDRTAYRKYLTATALEKKYAAQKKPRKDTLSKEQKNEKQAWENLVQRNKYDPKKDEADLKAVRETSYGKVWASLLPSIQGREAQWTYQTGIWDLTGMILLGMALAKTGFFSGRLSRNRYLLTTLLGLAGGGLLGWYRLHFGHVALLGYEAYVQRFAMPADLFFPFERALMAAGYASLVLLMTGTGVLNALWRALAAAGRMSLTNYLLQSIICTLFFKGFGFGYYGRLELYQLCLAAAEICLVEIVFSLVWLRYYREGPAEWLWRCLALKRWSSNKLQPPVQAERSNPAFS